MKRAIFYSSALITSLAVAGACYASANISERTYRGKLIFLDDGAFFRADHANPGLLPVKTCSSTGAYAALADIEIGQVWSVRFKGSPVLDDQSQTMRTRCIINITRFIEANVKSAVE